VADRLVLVTGAAGCVGHYMIEALLEEAGVQVRALVRDPGKLRADLRHHPRVDLVVADLERLPAEALEGVDAALHLAASWGGPRTYPVNVDATHALFDALADAGCQRTVYFSTASIVDGALRPLDVAAEAGTEYIRSKHAAYVGLGRTPGADRVVTVFPTLIFGGDAHHPYSQVSRGLPDVLRHLWLIRFLTADGSFQFVHARDLARVAARLLVEPTPPAAVAVGNPPITVREAVEAVCVRAGVGARPLLDATPAIGLLLRLFGARLSTWDRYCMRQRHLVYAGAWSAQSLGLPTDLATLPAVLAAHPLHI
jgi:nucleoside-diphosphate-sugar epimerase